MTPFKRTSCGLSKKTHEFFYTIFTTPKKRTLQAYLQRETS